MATVTLDRGNFVVIGQEYNGVYTEKFGEIMDFRVDESDANTHWLKIKMMVDINQNSLIDEIQNFSSQDLGRVPKLETYDAQEGNSILGHFQSRIQSRNEAVLERQDRQANTLQPVQGLGRLVRSDRDIPIDDMPTEEIGHAPQTARGPGGGINIETGEILEDTRDDVRDEARPMGIMPTRIRANNEEIAPEALKSFSLNLATGDMKTVMQIAHKSPKKVFGVIDLTIKESGHNVMNFIEEQLRGTFIDLKIQDLKDFSSLELKKNTAYTINREGESAYAYYLGDSFWILPENANSLSDIGTGLKDIDEEILKNYRVQEVEDRENVILGYCANLINRIDEDFKHNLDNNAQIRTITVQNADNPEKVTAEMFGKEWVDAITYYYFMGGEISWSGIDVTTFETKESILKLATTKNDSMMIELLEAA